MPEKNQDKIKKLEMFDQSSDLATFKELMNISEALGNFKNVEMVKIKGDKGDKGEKGDSIKGETGKEGKSIIGKEGKKGKDGVNGNNGLNGTNGDKGEQGEKGDLKDLSPEELRNSLELLQEDERIDISAIKGFKKLFSKLEKKIGNKVGHGGAPNNALMVADLTSQCNGILKEFQVPLHRKAIKVESTQFPVVYRPTTDFTTSNYTLTLTSEVGAPETGQTLIFYYIK